MTISKKLSLRFLLLVALLILPLALPDDSKAARICCSTCPAAVNTNSTLCYQLQALANECGIYWVQDPCEIRPAEVCIPSCNCDSSC